MKKCRSLQTHNTKANSPSLGLQFKVTPCFDKRMKTKVFFACDLFHLEQSSPHRHMFSP